MINPNDISTVSVGQLPDGTFSLTNKIAHEIGTELYRGTIQELCVFISNYIGTADGVGFRAVTVTDGQTLPTTTQQEFILVGKGTYYNVEGGATLILTEELNAIVSNGTYWFVGVEIPVNVELAGITQFIRSGFISTTPSESAIYDALALKADLTDVEDVANKTSAISGYSETLYPNEKASHDALDLKLNISDLPTNLTLYPTTTASDVSGYVVMVKDIHDVRYNTTAVDVSTPTITTTDQLVSQRISDAGILIGQPGVFNITTFGNIRHLSGSGSATFYFKVFHRDSAGVETLICTSSISNPVTDGGYSEFTASGVWDDGDFVASDRIVIKSYANRIAGGSDPVYQFQFGGTSPVRTLLPVPFSVVDAGYELSANKQNDLTPDGTGTKYPTVDAVNTIDLQKVLDVGADASVVSGDNFSNLEITPTYIALSQGKSSVNSRTGFYIDDEILSIEREAEIDISKTSIKIDVPTVITTLNFPAKTVAGDYTLATTDETVNLTENQTIEGEKTFVDNVYLESSTLLLNNSDKDGYGEIQNNLNRYLFVNQFGEIQFLMQNSGFATYKSPTISGTFSNANLTSNRTFTLPDVTGTIPIISQTITNGVTNKSPSEDAVYDALNNVSRNVVKDMISSSAVTGTLTETILKSYLIPQNTFFSSDALNIPSWALSKTGAAGIATFKLYVNTTNSLSGASLIATFATVATSLYTKIDRHYKIDAGNLTGFFFTATGSVSDILSSSGIFSTTPINVTSNFYIITTCTLANSSDSVTQLSFQATN